MGKNINEESELTPRRVYRSGIAAADTSFDFTTAVDGVIRLDVDATRLRRFPDGGTAPEPHKLGHNNRLFLWLEIGRAHV